MIATVPLAGCRTRGHDVPHSEAIGMIRVLARLSDGSLRTDVPVAELGTLRADPKTILWVDLVPANGEEQALEKMLLEQFGFHPLAVDDALRETHVPKVDDWRDYLYIVLHAVSFDKAEEKIRTHELDAFVGKNYLVSHHAAAIPTLDLIWNAVSREPKRLGSGPDNLLYQLVDAIVADYMPIVDKLDDWIEHVEHEVFRKPSPRTLARVFRQKRMLVGLRRTLAGLREVLNRLARDDYAVIDRRDRVYFRDVYDHVVRLYEIVESLRDLVAGVLDTYLSVNSNRINEVMKTLTIVTVLFMPISFMAGFFGMNFFGEGFALRPDEHGDWLFWISLAAMIALPPTMYVWMRLRKWL
jgi:magnesium transporter